MPRMKAGDFQKKSAEERDWEIFDTLQKGHETMGELRRDVNDVGERVDGIETKLDGHMSNPGAHHGHPKVRVAGNPGNPKKIATKRNAIIGAALTFGTAIVWLVIEVIN